MKVFALIVVLVLGAGGAYWYQFHYNAPAPKIESVSFDTTLNLKIEVTSECQMGDFDVIKGDAALLKRQRHKDLLVSVESLDLANKSFAPRVKRLNISELEQGQDLQFNLPEGKLDANLGIFLCRDRTKSNSCIKKKIYDFGELQASILKGGDKAVRRNDKVYFFQYLYAKDQKYFFLTDQVSNLKDAFKKIDQITANMKSQKSRAAVRRKTKRLYNALGSYVVTTTPTNDQLYLTMVLSKLDSKKCQVSSPYKRKQRTKIFKDLGVPPMFQDMGFGKKRSQPKKQPPAEPAK